MKKLPIGVIHPLWASGAGIEQFGLWGEALYLYNTCFIRISPSYSKLEYKQAS